nr:hypothetical protein [Tanacetum cinerariifolium]
MLRKCGNELKAKEGDRNNVRPIPVSINNKFLNCLQPEWSKYVTMVRHNQTRDTISYDQLYDSLVQLKPHVQASKVKKAAKNHDPLALIAHSNDLSSQFHANPSYLHSPQPYYVTHPSSVVDYEEDYQGDLQGDSQEDKLTTVKMLLARAITQKFSTLTNNHLRTLSNTRNQAMKDEAGSNLNDKENDFMLDNSFGDKTLKGLTATVIMLAQIQPAHENSMQKLNYDAKDVSKVNASHKMIHKGVHEHTNNGKRRSVINTSDDDQIDSYIIFDDPYVENNGNSDEHDSTVHDQYHDVKILAYNSLREGSYNSVRSPKSKDTKSKNRVLKNTNAKSSFAYVWKTSSSVRIDSKTH